MKIRKRMIKHAAKIYVSNVASAALESGGCSELLNEDEMAFFQEEVVKIAVRVSAQDASTMDECIELAIQTITNEQT